MPPRSAASKGKRVARGAACRAGRRWGRVGRRRRKQRAQGGSHTAAEVVLAGTRAERTLNMPLMVVTLDVSQLSGWLNAAARCRVEREPCGEEARHAGPGDGRGVGRRRRRKQRVQGGRQLWRLLAGHARGARPNHARHGCDPGCVEAQRLVEHCRALPRRVGRRRRKQRVQGGTQMRRLLWRPGQARSAPKTCSTWL